MKNSKIQIMTKISLCTALMCVAAFIAIPLPFTTVVLTLQTMILNLTALILTPKQSFFAMLVYVLLGAVGLPVFSGGTGGIGRILGPTGGFILGFLIVAPLISLFKGKKPGILRYCAVTLAGAVIFYICGALMFCILNKASIEAALGALVFPFIPGDVFKCILASFLAAAIQSRLDVNRS